MVFFFANHLHLQLGGDGSLRSCLLLFHCRNLDLALKKVGLENEIKEAIFSVLRHRQESLNTLVEFLLDEFHHLDPLLY